MKRYWPKEENNVIILLISLMFFCFVLSGVWSVFKVKQLKREIVGLKNEIVQVKKEQELTNSKIVDLSQKVADLNSEARNKDNEKRTITDPYLLRKIEDANNHVENTKKIFDN